MKNPLDDIRNIIDSEDNTIVFKSQEDDYNPSSQDSLDTNNQSLDNILENYITKIVHIIVEKKLQQLFIDEHFINGLKEKLINGNINQNNINIDIKNDQLKDLIKITIKELLSV